MNDYVNSNEQVSTDRFIRRKIECNQQISTWLAFIIGTPAGLVASLLCLIAFKLFGWALSSNINQNSDSLTSFKSPTENIRHPYDLRITQGNAARLHEAAPSSTLKPVIMLNHNVDIQSFSDDVDGHNGSQVIQERNSNEIKVKSKF